MEGGEFIYKKEVSRGDKNVGTNSGHVAIERPTGFVDLDTSFKFN